MLSLNSLASLAVPIPGVPTEPCKVCEACEACNGVAYMPEAIFGTFEAAELTVRAVVVILLGAATNGVRALEDEEDGSVYPAPSPATDPIDRPIDRTATLPRGSSGPMANMGSTDEGMGSGATDDRDDREATAAPIATGTCSPCAGAVLRQSN